MEQKKSCVFCPGKEGNCEGQSQQNQMSVNDRVLRSYRRAGSYFIAHDVAGWYISSNWFVSDFDNSHDLKIIISFVNPIIWNFLLRHSQNANILDSPDSMASNCTCVWRFVPILTNRNNPIKMVNIWDVHKISPRNENIEDGPGIQNHEISFDMRWSW
jgi:hypothetical protein